MQQLSRILIAALALGAGWPQECGAGNNRGFLQRNREKIGKDRQRQIARDKLLDEDLPRHIQEEREARDLMLRTLSETGSMIRSLERQVASYHRETRQRLDSLDRSVSSGSGSASASGSRSEATTRGAAGDSTREDELARANAELRSLKSSLQGREVIAGDEKRREMQDRHFALAEKVKEITHGLRRDMKQGLDGAHAETQLVQLQEAHEGLESLQERLWPAD